MAYLPAGVPDSRTRKAVLLSIKILREFRVKTLRLQFADETLDAYPLACLHNLGLQILALRETQNKFRDEIWLWRNEVQMLQASAPAGTNDTGVVLAEAHEILIFAILANRIHPASTLTPFSIERAVKRARESPFLKEASYVVSLLKAAFSIQGELEKSEISGHVYPHIISNPISLPETSIRVAKEGYKDYEMSMPDVEKVSCASLSTGRADRLQEIRRQAQLPNVPFDRLLTWFSMSTHPQIYSTRDC